MAKTINITYKEKKYVLEYTRKSIKLLEAQGFVIADLEKKPVTLIPKLFYGAFLAHQPTIKQDITDEIFEQIPNKEELLSKLSEMFIEPIEALMGDSTEGNAKWEGNW